MAARPFVLGGQAFSEPTGREAGRVPQLTLPASARELTPPMVLPGVAQCSAEIAKERIPWPPAGPSVSQKPFVLR